MMTISFCVNLIVLALVVPQIWRGGAGIDAAFGVDTPARRILACVYAAIWVLSAVGLALIVTGQIEFAVTLGVGLFSVQIAYKLMTVAAVGLGNPVVMTNLPIAVLHCVSLALIVLRA